MKKLILIAALAAVGCDTQIMTPEDKRQMMWDYTDSILCVKESQVTEAQTNYLFHRDNLSLYAEYQKAFGAYELAYHMHMKFSNQKPKSAK